VEQILLFQLLWPLEQSPVGSADTQERVLLYQQWGKSPEGCWKYCRERPFQCSVTNRLSRVPHACCRRTRAASKPY